MTREMRLFKQFESSRIIPVLALSKEDEAEPLSDALVDGGLTCIEAALDGDNALGVVRKLANRRELVVGASWVSSMDEAEAAFNVGADYVTCPGNQNNKVHWSSVWGFLRP